MKHRQRTVHWPATFPFSQPQGSSGKIERHSSKSLLMTVFSSFISARIVTRFRSHTHGGRRLGTMRLLRSAYRGALKEAMRLDAIYYRNPDPTHRERMEYYRRKLRLQRLREELYRRYRVTSG